MKQWFRKTMCLLLAGLALLSTGCVKTPEGEAVTAKTKIDGLHVGEVKSEDGTLTPQELGQPKHISESWTQALGDPDFGDTGGGQKLEYTVNIDADVIVPASGIFPVYGVSKAKYMDEDLFDRFVTVLFEGNEYVCYAPEGKVYEKGCFDVDGRYVEAEYSTGNAFYARMLTVHQGVDAFEIAGQDDSYREYLFFTETGTGAQMSGFRSSAEEDNVIGQFDAIFEYYGSGADINEDKEDLPSYILELERNNTSPEDALKLAEEFVNKVGLADKMTLAYSGRTKFMGPRGTGTSYETMGFAFVPKVGDARMAPIDVDDTVSTARLRYRNTASAMDFDALWLPNVLRVYVYNGRIFYVHWTSCTSDNNEGVISSNAPLKPFSEIYETFKAKLDLLGNIPPISANYAVPAERKVNINNIELCYYRVKAGTGAEDYALIPVWVFMGNIEWKYDDPSESQLIASPDGTVIQGGAGYCIMMINAIDGSVIDLTKGY
ncbi:MAG: hypothetical protein IKZ82_12285 [Clostridia bacterium]|nr:hypothetical protein [Clostridia bacterium]